MTTHDEKAYKYLDVLDYPKVKEKEIKTEFFREYKRRIGLILKSKLKGMNKIEVIWS